MRRVALALGPACLVLLASCGPKPADAIIGRWANADGGGVVVKFLTDGTVTSTVRNTVGRYQFIDRDRIRVEVPGQPAEELAVAVSGGELRLTDPDGRVTKFKRSP